jgi:hypothetical protein
MPRRRPPSLLLLLLYALALVLPQRAGTDLSADTACAWDSQGCEGSVLSFSLHTSATTLSGTGVRALADGGRPSSSQFDQLRLGGVPWLFVGRNEGARSRASSSTLEHYAVLASIRLAETGLRSSRSRAPPVLF